MIMSNPNAATAMPSRIYDVDIVKEIRKAVSTEGQRLEQNEPEPHEALLEKARALVAPLKSSLERIYRFMLTEVTYTSLGECMMMAHLTAQSPLCGSHGT